MATAPYKVTPHLAQGVERLAQIRSQIKALEVEESAVREDILRLIQDWPSSAFPVRIGHYELRRQDRRGRLDSEHLEQVIQENHCESEVPRTVTVASPAAAERLLQEIRTQAMPEASRTVLEARWHQALAVHFSPDAAQLEALFQAGRISQAQYRTCFKDGRPMIPSVVVR